MTCPRFGTHVISVLAEPIAFATRSATFDADKLGLPAWDITNVPARAIIEDQATRQTLGERPPYVGLDAEVGELSFSCYAQGAAPYNPAGPTSTALTRFISGAVGRIPTGDIQNAADGFPSATTVDLAAARAGVGADDGRIFLVPFQVDGSTRAYLRPALYEASTYDLLMQLPSAPIATDIVYAHNTWRWDEEGHTVTIQGDVLGVIQADGWEFYGGGGANMNLVGATPDAAPELSFELGVARMVSPALAATRTSPLHAHPLAPAAGAEMYIGTFGSATDILPIHWGRVEINTGRGYLKNPGINSEVGIRGYCLTSQEVRATVTVPVGHVPPATSGYASWRAAFEDQGEFHLLVSYGRGIPGRIFSRYLSRIHLRSDPEHGDTEGIATQTLTFGLSEGGSIYDGQA